MDKDYNDFVERMGSFEDELDLGNIGLDDKKKINIDKANKYFEERLQKNKEDNTIEKIEKVVKESLVDEDKNTINKEKKSDMNVKESNQYSNNDYEDIEKILNYYIK